MTALDSARKAYSASASPLRTERGTEYQAFARTTRGLTSAATLGKSDFGAMAHAVHENRRLWTTLAADVAETGNRLPEVLKAQIFYLAEFTHHHSRKILAGDAEAGVLVEINTAVMRGLRSQGASK